MLVRLLRIHVGLPHPVVPHHGNVSKLETRSGLYCPSGDPSEPLKSESVRVSINMCTELLRYLISALPSKAHIAPCIVTCLCCT